MDLKIIEKKEEPLLSRIAIKADVPFTAATPSKKDIKTKIAMLLKANENLIVVNSIKTLYGEKKAVAVCYKYDDEKKLKLIEPPIKEKKEKSVKTKAPAKEEKK